jgi:hypothetical protein
VVPEQTVWALGQAVPVDPDGRFAMRQLLPAGRHTVEVETTGPGDDYTKFSRNPRALWGSFQTSWTGLELNQFSRGLYGAGVLLKSQAVTSHGERRLTQDLFAAEPGTLNSREEFRGTGGSLHYLNRQDITRGSERLWVEVRDQTSGIVH